MAHHHTQLNSTPNSQDASKSQNTNNDSEHGEIFLEGLFIWLAMLSMNFSMFFKMLGPFGISSAEAFKCPTSTN
jgi:hypothetical protein